MEQHDYIVLLEKFFKKEASSEERRILIEWMRKPGIRNEFNLLCEQMWKEAAVEIDKTVEEEIQDMTKEAEFEDADGNLNFDA